MKYPVTFVTRPGQGIEITFRDLSFTCSASVLYSAYDDAVAGVETLFNEHYHGQPKAFPLPSEAQSGEVMLELSTALTQKILTHNELIGLDEVMEPNSLESSVLDQTTDGIVMQAFPQVTSDHQSLDGIQETEALSQHLNDGFLAHVNQGREATSDPDLLVGKVTYTDGTTQVVSAPMTTGPFDVVDDQGAELKPSWNANTPEDPRLQGTGVEGLIQASHDFVNYTPEQRQIADFSSDPVPQVPFHPPIQVGLRDLAVLDDTQGVPVQELYIDSTPTLGDGSVVTELPHGAFHTQTQTVQPATEPPAISDREFLESLLPKPAHPSAASSQLQKQLAQLMGKSAFKGSARLQPIQQRKKR